MAYGTTAAERVLVRCEQRLKKQCEKLQAQLAFYEYSRQDAYHEALLLFFKNFEDYYENDTQYLRFLFIATKNKIINIKKSNAVWVNRFKCDLPNIDPESEFGTQAAIENCVDPRINEDSMSKEQILGLFKSRKLKNAVCDLMTCPRKELKQLKGELNPKHFAIIQRVVQKHLIAN